MLQIPIISRDFVLYQYLKKSFFPSHKHDVDILLKHHDKQVIERSDKNKNNVISALS